MKKTLFISVVAFALSGCAAISTRAPLTGFWYTETEADMIATGAAAGNRMGEACAKSILGLVATGDASIETARKNGGISVISTVDTKDTAILGVYATHCTVVRGK